MEKLLSKYNGQGFKQFLTNKLRLLKAFEFSKIYTQNHIVKVEHGNVAEAEFRLWLSNFLPDRFGVTSGFIISPKLTEQNLTPHYDIVIYDRINSPILWEEANPDSSKSGNSKAIPVEYVHAIFEVKSQLTSKTAKEAIEHLQLLEEFIKPKSETTIDNFRPYLPDDFACGCIFFELLEANIKNPNILNNLLPSQKTLDESTKMTFTAF